MYFKIWFGEDGIVIEPIDSKENVIKSIEDSNIDEFIRGPLTRKLSMNDHYPTGKTIIIEGDVITPQPARITLP